MYLKEIHYLGRKLKSNNPFYLIREAKARRRRAAMASLLAQLARGMIFAHKDYNELSRKKSKKKRAKRRGSHVCELLRMLAISANVPNEKFMFARLPPDPPSDCQVISTSAYSVRIAWAPAFSTESDLTYNIRYRLKFNYIVYFTENPNASLSEWEKIPVNGRRVVFPDLRYDWFYMFSATAVFKDGQRSPLSRALFIKTDKLEFHKHCVGQSRTIEVMDSICDRTEDSETTALLKRDYASFAV
ncbi:fibronectin type III domain protein [Ancylostoma ceylanicum]|uniref:Fibronectin type III domain protein n=1 Tax=Ancylostoma ceylanicum TaxID=53326 RepID=A0A0D6L9P0_9BILA|nr:fibronectin type III domain protein [Ancylostoma ceylanicum]